MKYEIDTGYQKQVGWINSGDGFLVLDRDFNQSVDNGTELLSNPLVADAAKGLRSLATWDANGDGKITAADPIFNQLKVWQDFNQDGQVQGYEFASMPSFAPEIIALCEENTGTRGQFNLINTPVANDGVWDVAA